MNSQNGNQKEEKDADETAEWERERERERGKTPEGGFQAPLGPANSSAMYIKSQKR